MAGTVRKSKQVCVCVCGFSKLSSVARNRGALIGLPSRAYVHMWGFVCVYACIHFRFSRVPLDR